MTRRSGVLDLERVKPNTLGNTRMLLRLVTGPGKMSIGVARDGTIPAGPSSSATRDESRGEETAVLSDLAALTPPLVVGVACLIGVAMLLRSQMSPKRRRSPD